MSDLSQFMGGAPKKWVSGTTYAEGVVVWSPADYQYFMRKTAGAGATDPSSDTTNWQPTGDRAIKSIQRGILNVNGVTSANVTITSVNTNKTELRFLGFNTTGTDTLSCPILSIINATTINITKVAGGGSTNVSWELTERY